MPVAAAAGLYGVRVVVDVVSADASASLPYPPYFANLIVVAEEAFGQGAVTAKRCCACSSPAGACSTRRAGGDAAWG